jgi:hypothetical protein
MSLFYYSCSNCFHPAYLDGFSSESKRSGLPLFFITNQIRVFVKRPNYLEKATGRVIALWFFSVAAVGFRSNGLLRRIEIRDVYQEAQQNLPSTANRFGEEAG